MKKLDPRSVIIGFLIAVIGFMSLGATNSTFESITVGEIKMKNESLAITSPDGNRILETNAFPKMNIVAFYNKEGIATALIGNSDVGDGMFEIYNAKGQNTMMLAHNPLGNGVITVNNKHGKTAVSLSGGTAGDVSIYNGEGTNTVSLSHTTGNQGVVSINNNNGENIIRLGSNLSADPAIRLTNKHQKPVAALSVTDEADGFIILSDRYGEVQWSMTGKRK